MPDQTAPSTDSFPAVEAVEHALRGPAPEVPADAGHATELKPNQRLAIYLILVAAFVVILNETILGVALTPIMEELQIDPSTGQWLLTAFMLTMAIVIPLSGFLLKRFTTRQVFLGAIGIFAVGTLTAAMAPGFEMLLTGRILQAAGTGVMMPMLMTTVMTLVPPRQRGQMMGNISIVIAVAPALGPTISGIILNSFHWRAIFWLVLPIAIAALILGAIKLPNVTETKNISVDALSIVLSAFAFGGLIFGLSEMGHAVEGSSMIVPPWAIVIFGAVSLAAFVLRQIQLQKKDRALIDLRVFLSPGYRNGVILMASLMAVMFGSIILLPIYAQQAAGLDTLQTGLALLPGGLLMGFAGPIVGRLYDRVGPRPLVVPGVTIVALALWGMAFFFVEGAPMWVIIVMHVTLSLGLALTFTPLFTSALGAVEPPLYSYASAALGTAQQLAGAAGTALFIVIYTIAAASATQSGAAQTDVVTAGTHAAFIAAAIGGTALIAIAFLIKRPASEMSGGMAIGH